MNGTLYIVSTPIGNLADITHRALEILASVNLIAAEDTRRTRNLLNHYGITTSVSSYNSFNKLKKGGQFLGLLGEGKDIALVSDAGTPGVSDPLYHLVTAAVAEGIRISPDFCREKRAAGNFFLNWPASDAPSFFSSHRIASQKHSGNCTKSSATGRRRSPAR